MLSSHLSVPTRHLAAILSADVAGYGRLMAEDEVATAVPSTSPSRR